MDCNLPKRYTVLQSILESESDKNGVIRVVRPMIVLPNTDDSPMKFPKPNICFFLSTGNTNDRKFPGSWYPTPGIATKEINQLYLDNGMEEMYFGKIIKCSDLTNGRSKLTHIREWAAELLKNYCKTIFSRFDYLSITTFPSQYSKEGEEGYNQIYNFLNDIIYIIDSYFLTSWQLAVSAILGNGFWAKYPLFRDFVIAYQSNLIPTHMYLETFSLEHIVKTPSTDEEVVVFLMQNCAQMTEFYNPVFKPGNNHYKRDIFTFKFRYEQALNAIKVLTRKKRPYELDSEPSIKKTRIEEMTQPVVPIQASQIDTPFVLDQKPQFNSSRYNLRSKNKLKRTAKIGGKTKRNKRNKRKRDKSYKR